MRHAMRSVPTGDVKPDINVTPLVDIVLVLLIIFMVVTPQMEQDVHIDLPGIFNPDPDVKVSDPLKISIAKADEYHVGDQTFDLEQLTAYLATERAADPLRRLVLRADTNLEFGAVRAIFAKTQELGFPGLSFMVGEKHRAGEAPAAAPASEPVSAPEAAPADAAQPPADAAPVPAAPAAS